MHGVHINIYVDTGLSYIPIYRYTINHDRLIKSIPENLSPLRHDSYR